MPAGESPHPAHARRLGALITRRCALADKPFLLADLALVRDPPISKDYGQ